MSLEDDIANHSTSSEFYWAMGEHLAACGGISDHLEELESALQWCKDHSAVVGFYTNYVNVMVGKPHAIMHIGDNFLDAVERAKVWLEGVELNDTNST